MTNAEAQRAAIKAERKPLLKLDRILRTATGLDGWELVEFFTWFRGQSKRRSALGALARDFIRKAEARDVAAFVAQTDWAAAREVLKLAAREYEAREP